MTYREVLKFWFEEIPSKNWFTKDPAFDHHLRDRFGATLGQASQCELYSWRATLPGRLAEIIVLDQFSRNIYRDKPESFAQDKLALVLAQEAVADCRHKDSPPAQKAFLYMPFMHSESKALHEVAVELFSQPGLESNLNFEMKHKEIIDRFGRFPHRNRILGRKSTPEEIEFLKQPGSSF